MSFNFGSLATTQAVSNYQARLKPWNIYTVKFAGASKAAFTGKKDPSQNYEVLRVRFEGEDGYYEESIFFPKSGDEIRPKYTNKDGHEYEGASSFERTMTFIAQVANALNPDGFKKMQAASSKFKSFDDVVTAFIKVTDIAKGKEVKLKLVGKNRQGNVEAGLPKFVAVNGNTGECFTSDTFIGDKVFFSDYELKKKAEFETAVPTKMDNHDEIAMQVDGSSNDDDMDFESLL